MALKDITLGQYFPGHSFVHKLDPRTKLLAVVLYIVALFLAKSFVTYGIMFLLLAVSIAVSKVPVKSIFRGMKPVVFIVIFTAILNLFYTPGDTVLVRFWIFTITLEGVFNAFFMVVRILMLIAGTFLLTYTTSPILLTDGLEKLMGPLKTLHVPVHELSMMMSIALRFILPSSRRRIRSCPLRSPRRRLRYRQPAPEGQAWCPCWYPCSFLPSAGPTSLPLPWSAAATTAERAAPACASSS